MNLKFKDIINNQSGNAIVMAMMAAVVSAVTAITVMQQGKERLDMSSDMIKNTVIQNTMLEIRTLLANPVSCQEAMTQSPPFSKIGTYKASLAKENAVYSGVFIEQIEVQDNDIAGNKEQIVRIRFLKQFGPKKKTYKADFVKVKRFTTPDGVETCASFATSSIEQTVSDICDNFLGGTFKPETGKCENRTGNLDPAFKNAINREVCNALGGSYDNSTHVCSGYNIPGTLKTTNLDPNNEITLSKNAQGHSENTDLEYTATHDLGISKTNLIVATGLKDNGKLDSAAVQCAQPGTAAQGASGYSPILVGNEIKCQCDMSRGNKTACGSMINTADLCEDTLVDDGCGLGNKCVIKWNPQKVKKTCPKNPACGTVVRDRCGRICDVGPPCPIVAEETTPTSPTPTPTPTPTPSPTTPTPAPQPSTCKYEKGAIVSSSVYSSQMGISNCGGVIGKTCTCGTRPKICKDGYQYYEAECSGNSPGGSSNSSSSTSTGSSNNTSWDNCSPTGGLEACGCFVAGTQIRMHDNSLKNVEDIKVGDRVIGSEGINTVLKLKPSIHMGAKYSINGSMYFVTKGHPFMTQDGWKAIDLNTAKVINPDLDLKQLKIGDFLVTENGFEKVETIDFHTNAENIYNFELDGTKDYYADGYLVHNK